MADIKASDVAKLRSMTNAGMMDCKKALTEADGDLDAAVEIIRKCHDKKCWLGPHPKPITGPAAEYVRKLKKPAGGFRYGHQGGSDATASMTAFSEAAIDLNAEPLVVGKGGH